MKQIMPTYTVKKKVVLCFDICSSTSILEDLTRSENLKLWRDLLIAIKNFLRKERISLGFEIYKFIGDGWIILFEPGFSSSSLLGFIKRLCKNYEDLFISNIKPVLSTEIKNVGISFGLDRGTVIIVVMDGKTEYIGRAINVATRLQAAIKDKDSRPQGKVLMSNSAYVEIEPILDSKYKVMDVKRDLKNISGGKNYLAKKLFILKKLRKKS